VTSGADWAEQARALVETLRGVLGSLADPDDRAAGEATPQPAECRWCPLCQVIAVLRGERPEVTAALADVLRATADALHAFAAAPEGPRPASPPAQEGAEASAADPPPTVQRIEIA
jgi:hypothetical protein